MRFGILSRFNRNCIEIPGRELLLRPPLRSDMHQWIKLRGDSSGFLRQWEPRWPDDDLSPHGYLRRLMAYKRHAQSGTARTYFLIRKADNELLGGISMTRMRPGRDGSATLGYWMGACHAGRGYMSAAVPAIVHHAFENMKLAHVDAACLPHNRRSRHLLVKSGFQEICRMPDYLEINGVMEDHILLRKVASMPCPGTVEYAKNAGISKLPMV